MEIRSTDGFEQGLFLPKAAGNALPPTAKGAELPLHHVHLLHTEQVLSCLLMRSKEVLPGSNDAGRFFFQKDSGRWQNNFF